MDSLMSKPTPGDIKVALKNLPRGEQGLDATYEQAMERIEGQEADFRKLARQVLSWVIHAKRPLSGPEIRHALGVRTGMSELDDDFLPELEDLVSVCAGLVTVDEESNIVRLVHYTTQEYFGRTWTSWFPCAQTDITKTCVTYLSFDKFETGFCPTDEEFEARLRSNALYDYAARNWGHHARVATTEMAKLILGLLESEAKISACSQAMTASRSYSGYSQRVPKRITEVHLAAYFGLKEVMMVLLKNGHHLDCKDTYSQTPLSWAAGNGHEAVVKLLLEKGAELESKDNGGQTPLSRAAEKGHEAVVKLLLEKGAELDSKDKGGQTPLSWAAQNGHEAVVKLLQSHA
jgi:Ankyrin repeats (3 copies)/Ankyrin repeat